MMSIIDPMNQAAGLRPNKWTTKPATELIRALNPFVKPFHYQLVMGGEVLMSGESTSGLQLFFLPLGGGLPSKPIDLISWLGSLLGKGVTPTLYDHGYLPGAPREYTNSSRTAYKPAPTIYQHHLHFKFDGLLIEVFIV